MPHACLLAEEAIWEESGILVRMDIALPLIRTG